MQQLMVDYLAEQQLVQIYRPHCDRADVLPGSQHIWDVDCCSRLRLLGDRLQFLTNATPPVIDVGLTVINNFLTVSMMSLQLYTSATLSESVPGPKGDTGDAGIQGIQGNTGLTGANGFQGIQGVKGDTGTTGIQGIKGDTGSTGAQGTTGLSGADGSPGATGSIGSTGLQGIQGTKGDAGSQGIKGDTGLTGSQGIQGTAGTNGTNGATGSTGSQGTTGATGPAGLGTVIPSTPTRVLGAAFQPNASKATLCSYSISLSVTNPLIAGNSTAQVQLLSDSSNPPTTVRSTVAAGSSVSIAVAIALTTSNTTPLDYIVPAGHYVKLVSTTSGTASASIVAQTEETLG